MREIKFKYILQHDETGRIISRIFTIKQIETGKAQAWIKSCERWNVVDRLEFTGRKDKKGTDIYEGDITKTKDGYDICIDQAIYNTAHNKFMLTSPYSSKLAIGLGEYTDIEIEIIGNIHDNPELLEVEK